MFAAGSTAAHEKNRQLIDRNWQPMRRTATPPRTGRWQRVAASARPASTAFQDQVPRPRLCDSVFERRCLTMAPRP